MKRRAFLPLLAAAWPALARAAGSELWVAVGDGGMKMTSSDGEKWQRDKSKGAPLAGIAYGLEKFIAVGGTEKSSVILATRDGKKWSELPSTGSRISAIAFGKDRFVAIQGAQLLFSTDGASFKAGARLDRESGGKGARTFHPLAIACGDTEAGFRFVILGESEVAGESEPKPWRAVTGDGTRVEDFSERPAVTSVAYGAGHFVAVGAGRLEWSHDGQTWEPLPCPGDVLQTVVWTGNRFLAIGPEVLWISRDALNWQRQPAPGAQPLLWARDAPPVYLGQRPGVEEGGALVRGIAYRAE